MKCITLGKECQFGSGVFSCRDGLIPLSTVQDGFPLMTSSRTHIFGRRHPQGTEEIREEGYRLIHDEKNMVGNPLTEDELARQRTWGVILAIENEF